MKNLGDPQDAKIEGIDRVSLVIRTHRTPPPSAIRKTTIRNLVTRSGDRPLCKIDELKRKNKKSPVSGASKSFLIAEGGVYVFYIS